MTWVVRDLDETSEAELEAVARMCMAAPLETIPELAGSSAIARQRWPNFELAAMIQMIREDYPKPTHRRLVAVNADGRVLGHSIVFHKIDADGTPYGYFFSRYVDAQARRQGISSALMIEALAWFDHKGLVELRAHTHATNLALQGLYSKFGFELGQRVETPWPTVALVRRS